MTNNLPKINFKIFTLFPELFPGPLAYSIIGNGLEQGLWQYQTINIRDYASDQRKTVDDTVYGGSAGMILKPEVVANALEQNLKNNSSPIYYLSARGKVFNQSLARQMALQSQVNFLCARYEGIDQRVLDEFAIEEISLGDFILSGGEIACMAMIDAILRNIEGILGCNESLSQESFGNSDTDDYRYLLEYPHYTKPSLWRNRQVPEILLSGHHQNIDNWRKEQAEEITKKNRPDLYQQYCLLKNNKK